MATDILPTSNIAFAAITVCNDDSLRTVTVPISAQTLEGFRQWALSNDFPERGQFSLVAGELLVDMSPEYYETHYAIKSEISAVIYSRVKQLSMGRFFSDRFLLSNENARISTEPDAMFASPSAFESGRCQIVDSTRLGIAEELLGTPDWVAEIVSKTSARKDKKLLQEGYFRAGIPEYWLVDALGNEIEFQILVPDNDSYVAVEPQNGWLASPTFGCLFHLTRENDPEGLPRYTLHVQENPEP